MVFILTISIFLIGFERKYGEGLCVDGAGDINLEGFMCEKETATLYGHSNDFIGGISLFISFILILIFSFFGSLICLLNGLLEEE